MIAPCFTSSIEVTTTLLSPHRVGIGVDVGVGVGVDAGVKAGAVNDVGAINDVSNGGMLFVH